MPWTKVAFHYDDGSHGWGTFVKYDELHENDFVTVEDRKGNHNKYYYGTIIHIDENGFTIELEMTNKKEKFKKEDIDEDLVTVLHKVGGGWV